jgi:hypothetical protein
MEDDWKMSCITEKKQSVVDEIEILARKQWLSIAFIEL